MKDVKIMGSCPTARHPAGGFCRAGLLGLALLGLSGCQTFLTQPSCPPCPACAPGEAPHAVAAKPLQAAGWQDLTGWSDEDHRAAWAAFLHSCRVLSTRHTAWQRVCLEAGRVDGQSAAAVRTFFESQLVPYAVTAADGKREGLITGYYEPLLKGARTQTKHWRVPVLGVPDDLLTIDLGAVWPELKSMRLRGRLVGNKVVPYYTRKEIEAGKTAHSGRTLLWVADPVEYFFLQVQGSGRVELPDGKRVRLAYADQNGHPYQSVGKVLIERGELRPGEASMQGIQAWAREHPERLQALLNTNPSYVFFRELPDADEGPRGALGVPLVAERSLAVDQRYIPLGAPVFLATTQPDSGQPLNRLMLAQDTGGAIKGAVRADFFWGFGPKAGERAGRMKQSGRLWVLLPLEMAPKQ